MVTIDRLDSENVSAYYDMEAQIAFITYRNEVNPATTKLAYEWIGKSAAVAGITNVRGGVFDFREVTKFGGYNFTVVRQERQKVKAKHDFSHIPTALIVKNLFQERMVMISLKITEKSERVKIVEDMESALDFIQDWHEVRK